MAEGQLIESPRPANVCTFPRCKSIAVRNTETRWWATCFVHSLELVERDLERLKADRAALMKKAAAFADGEEE